MVDGHVDEQRLLHLQAETDEERRAPKIDPDRADLSDRAVREERLDGPIPALEAKVLACHEEQAGFVCALDHLLRLTDARCERLLPRSIYLLRISSAR